jgi:nitric oxide reductase NorQ protein
MFDHPPVEVESRIIESESSLSKEDSLKLAEMGSKLRELKGFGLDEGVSSRLLVYVGRLMKEGLSAAEACGCAISQTLTDEAEVMESINSIVSLYFGSLSDEQEE